MSADRPLMTFAPPLSDRGAARSLPRPPLPRHLKLPGPQTLASLELLLGMLSVAVPWKINRPASRHHPASEVAPECSVGAVSILAGGRDLAARHDSTIAIRTPMRSAGHRMRPDQLGKVQGRNLAAPVGLPGQGAGLPALRASMPPMRIRWPWISSVSPSITEARPIRAGGSGGGVIIGMP